MFQSLNILFIPDEWHPGTGISTLEVERRLLENYCFVLLTNRAPPQISDNRPDMRHRA